MNLLQYLETILNSNTSTDRIIRQVKHEEKALLGELKRVRSKLKEITH